MKIIKDKRKEERRGRNRKKMKQRKEIRRGIRERKRLQGIRRNRRE